jgi:hypothetical protein
MTDLPNQTPTGGAPIIDPKPGAAETFGTVLADELADIRTRRLGEEAIGRAKRDERATLTDERKTQRAAWDMNLVGLAISGGGIRSATFALGLLQALADAGLLRFIDYLSTVSGGGYIGSWLAAWVKREGSLTNVEKQLRPNRAEQAAAERKIGDVVIGRHVFDEEPEPVCHLRRFSSYLTPVYGLFSADTWAFVSIYLRNFLLNQLMLLPLVILLVLLCRCLVWPFAAGAGEVVADVLAIGTLLLLAGVFFFSHFETRKLKRPRCDGASPGAAPARPAGLGRMDLCIVFPLLTAAVLVCFLYTQPLGQPFSDSPQRGRGGLALVKPVDDARARPDSRQPVSRPGGAGARDPVRVPARLRHRQRGHHPLPGRPPGTLAAAAGPLRQLRLRLFRRHRLLPGHPCPVVC